jgi:NADPH:quinone reductase
MRAVWLREFGGPDVLVAADAPEPVAGPGQALIDVAFANITFVETQFRATGAGPFEPALPMIPGNGVGGVVAAVGPGADAALIGRRVVAGTGGAGGYAERAAVDVATLVAVPDGLQLDAAVALLADGRTATMLVRAVGLRAGQRVLVEAAAGGVGTLLVQLAHAAGATVIAAAGGERKLALARELGADVAVDYTQADWGERAGAVDWSSTASAARSPARRSRCSRPAGACSASASRAAPGPRSARRRRRSAASRSCDGRARRPRSCASTPRARWPRRPPAGCVR